MGSKNVIAEVLSQSHGSSHGGANLHFCSCQPDASQIPQTRGHSIAWCGCVSPSFH